MVENIVGANGATVSIIVEPERQQPRRRIVLLDENGNNTILDLDTEERRKLVEALEELGTEVW